MVEVGRAAGRAGLAVVAAYDGLSLDDADDESERVHWVFRRADDAPRAA